MKIKQLSILVISFLQIISCEYEAGIPAVLPPNNVVKEYNISERNILRISLTESHKVNIENINDQSVDDIKNQTKLFLTNPNDNSDYPSRILITKELCKNKIDTINKEDSNKKNTELVKWKKRLKSVSIIGDYETVNDSALILISYSESNSYLEFLLVRDAIMESINSMRNSYAIEKFGVSYDTLIDQVQGKKAEVLTEKIEALRIVIPTRIEKIKI